MLYCCRFTLSIAIQFTLSHPCTFSLLSCHLFYIHITLLSILSFVLHCFPFLHYLLLPILRYYIVIIIWHYLLLSILRYYIVIIMTLFIAVHFTLLHCCRFDIIYLLSILRYHIAIVLTLFYCYPFYIITLLSFWYYLLLSILHYLLLSILRYYIAIVWHYFIAIHFTLSHCYQFFIITLLSIFHYHIAINFSLSHCFLGSRWNDLALTYKITGYTQDMSRNAVDQIMTRAFQVSANHKNLKRRFVRIKCNFRNQHF